MGTCSALGNSLRDVQCVCSMDVSVVLGVTDVLERILHTSPGSMPPGCNVRMCKPLTLPLSTAPSMTHNTSTGFSASTLAQQEHNTFNSGAFSLSTHQLKTKKPQLGSSEVHRAHLPIPCHLYSSLTPERTFI
jgi:hypothetical protein